MLQITEVAQKKILEAINNYKEPVLGLRVIADARSPFQVHYGLAFVPEDGVKKQDKIINFSDFDVYYDKESSKYLDEATLDFEDNLQGQGFKFLNTPGIPEEYKGTIAEKVVRVIEEKVNPQIASHGGHISLVDVKGTEVIIQMGGGCQGCGMANVTLKDGVEVMLKEAIPEITAIYDVTDHAGGKNPYYNS